MLSERYLRSVEMDDIDVAVVNTFSYLAYDNPNLPSTGGRRLQGTGRELLQSEKTGANVRLTVTTSAIRAGSEIEAVSQVRAAVLPSLPPSLALCSVGWLGWLAGTADRAPLAVLRPASPRASSLFPLQGVNNGSLAKDLSLAGLKTDNVTMLMAPEVKGVAANQDNSTSGALEGWAIGVIVAVVLLLLPIPGEANQLPSP